MWMESDNARDGTLSGFFSCGSTNRLGGSGESDFGCYSSWLGGMVISFMFS